MAETSDKLEEFKERVRSRYPHSRPQGRLGVPWYILVVNVLLIGYILFIYGRQSTRDEAAGAMIQYRNIEYRLTIIKERDSGERMITVATRALGQGSVTARYAGPVATVEFRHGNSAIASVNLGEGAGTLAFKGGEMKTFVESYPLLPLVKYAAANPGSLQPKKKSLISTEARHLPMSLMLTVHTDDPVSTSVDYKFYEVD
jgi:hypothetical protein